MERVLAMGSLCVPLPCRLLLSLTSLLRAAFFGIVDFLAIAPYYIELFLGVDTSVMFRFSILRTFRLLRVFRAFRTNNTITLCVKIHYLSVAQLRSLISDVKDH